MTSPSVNMPLFSYLYFLYYTMNILYSYFFKEFKGFDGSIETILLFANSMQCMEIIFKHLLLILANIAALVTKSALQFYHNNSAKQIF